MSEALSLAVSASLVTPIQPLGASLTPAQTPASPAPGHININGPVYISPAISFDPVTDIVFFTYRNAETGKVTEQFPPAQVASRYLAVDETGVPNPTLPLTTPDSLAAATARPPSGSQPDAPPPQPPAPSSIGSSTAGTAPASRTIA